LILSRCWTAQAYYGGGSVQDEDMEFIDAEKDIEGYMDELFDKGYFIDFSPVIKTPQEALRISPLYLDIVEDAIIVYDNDDFFKKILENVRNELKKLEGKGTKHVWR
jgi:hypothetical protein